MQALAREVPQARGKGLSGVPMGQEPAWRFCGEGAEVIRYGGKEQ